MQIFSLAVSLFLLMDAIGNVPIFLSILSGLKSDRQRSVILRELIIALCIMMAFYFIGSYFLNVLKVTQTAVLISGGIILFLIGIKMVFPSHSQVNVYAVDKEPFLVPLAVPLVAGPAVLAAIILYSHQDIATWVCLTAILIAWAATTLILVFSPLLKKLLGNRGLQACEHFTGLLLIMISVQMFLNAMPAAITTS